MPQQHDPPSAVPVGGLIRDTRLGHRLVKAHLSRTSFCPAGVEPSPPSPPSVVRTACMGCSRMLTDEEHRTHQCPGDRPLLGPRQEGKR